MIHLENIKKVFRTEDIDTWALREVSIDVRQGEFVAVMGPSGCGKTTLLNIMGLIDTPTEGTYLLEGRDVSRLTERERTQIRRGAIGFVFQSFNLIDDLNVYENVELSLLYMGLPAAERRQRVMEVLDRLAMSHRRLHFPCQLSGGQQQRVALARAVVGRPRLILADEPTGNLDSVHGGEVMRLLCDLSTQGTTIVMVTHSLHCASFAHRTIDLFDGQVVPRAEL